MDSKIETLKQKIKSLSERASTSLDIVEIYELKLELSKLEKSLK